MDIAEIIITSAENTLNNYQDQKPELIARLLEHLLTVHTQDLAAHLNESDRTGFVFVVEVLVDGSWRDGALLTLSDRAILAWSTGTLRLKTFTTVIHYAGVTGVTVEDVESIVMRPRTVIHIGGQVPADIRVWRMTGVLSPAVLEATLAGSVTYDYDDPVCSQCMADLPASSVYCPICRQALERPTDLGVLVVAGGPSCTECLADLVDGALYCHICGAGLKGD